MAINGLGTLKRMLFHKSSRQASVTKWIFFLLFSLLYFNLIFFMIWKLIICVIQDWILTVEIIIPSL